MGTFRIPCARKNTNETPPGSEFRPKAESVGSADSSSILSPDAGKRTPDGVRLRHGVGQHGGNPDLMAQIREKRASMVPKTTTTGGSGDELELSPKTEVPKAELPAFGNVKLR